MKKRTMAMMVIAMILVAAAVAIVTSSILTRQLIETEKEMDWVETEEVTAWTDGAIVATFEKETGTLVFSGKGTVYHVDEWLGVEGQLVKKMVFEPGVDAVHSTEFSHLGPNAPVNLEEVIFEGDMLSIGDCAFSGMLHLKKVTFQGDCKEIGVLAFMNCLSLEEEICVPVGCHLYGAIV